MTVESPDDTEHDDVERAADYLRSGASYVRSTITWAVLLNLVVGWTFFWSNVAKLHLSQGDTVGAAITSMFVVPVFLVPAWWLSSKVGFVGVEGTPLGS